MDDWDSEWQRKGATLSDKTALEEFGLTQEEIVQAIREGTLQYREDSMYGNPWLRLLRREVEALVRQKHGYMRKTESIEDVRRWFAGVIRDLWPVAVGSPSLRKGPCIRPNCPACASGEGHSSHALYGRRGTHRFSVYVPERLVPEVRAAIQNGRRLQEFINEAGVRYVSALKREDAKNNR